jgi:hypothetical protein
MFAELSTLARVSLGYKSLQNNFFYLNEATIDSFGVEKKYLTPILMMKDLNGRAYKQAPEGTLWLFNCKDKKADLRGTGALRYIDAMADHPATEKKQTGKTLTIREALEAQGGGTWYAPKARPNGHHVWLRKAFDAVFSPFLFSKPALVDQRCNSLSPVDGVTWQELAAALTTSFFAYSLEINGSASMGAGALEAPTTKLRSYPALNVVGLKPADRKKLVELAEKVWTEEAPIDWSLSASMPGERLRDLDKWILDLTSANVSLDAVYRDIRETCQSRKAVASDKQKKTKKKRTDNIGNVADSIAKVIAPKMQIRNFPDDFLPGTALDIAFSIDRSTLKAVNMSHLLGNTDIRILSNSGATVYEGTHPNSVAEAIVRSLLWGRSQFSVSSDAKAMDKGLAQFLTWVSEIEKNIATAIAESALGTGYEDALKREIHSRLGIHPLLADKTLPQQISFASNA